VRYLLPAPYPDELLGSLWIRMARRTQLSIAVLTQAVVGGAKGRPGIFHLGNLRAMGAGVRIAPELLLWNHTVFPYSTAFFRKAALVEAVQSALSTGADARKVGAIVQSVSDFSRLRRFCASCAQEELAATGETYWHRQHNLPGVQICLRHLRGLSVTELPTTSTRWHSALPGDLLRLLPRVGRKKPSRLQVLLAELSNDVIIRAPLSSVHRDADWYREAVVMLGLASHGRNIDAAKLTDWFARQLGKLADAVLPERDRSLRWSALMVRPGSNQPIRTFKHLLLEAALRLQEPTRKPILNHEPRGFRGYATPQADAQFARKVRLLVNKYVALGERVPVAEVLTEAGCWSRFRHARDMYPAIAREVVRLKESAAAMRPNWGKGSTCG